ncbi:MAG: thioredoxin family protein [Magnetovibrio sp.]|nr:thioredoxin family protein [Magnetovibrio sp.]
MKRKKHKAKRQPNPQSPPPAVKAAAEPTRRDFLRTARKGALIAVVAGGGGWFVVNDVRATMREHDLTQIGNGTPTVVQIHDPECPRCVALQRETRDALCELGDDKLQFVVANIRSAKGAELARAHGVGNVTLLLFDGEGRRRDILAGPAESDYLAARFRQHLARYGDG